MQIPRIWERQTAQAVDDRGNQVEAFAWGWSESSVDEARQKALTSAQRIVKWLCDLGASQDPQHYGYDERLPREEIIDEYVDSGDQPHAFVSRNAYGSLILNTRDLMFIDVDLPPPKPANPLSIFATLFGGKPAVPADPADELMEEIRGVAQQYADLGFRVYRTFNGFRIMVANRQISPESSLSQELLSRFRSDPLYVRMCKNQQCFRARLTPKAWRCKIGKPPVRYPFEGQGAESQYRRWEQSYIQGTERFSVCNLVEMLGSREVHAELQGLVAIHDQLTKSADELPLA